MSLACSVKLLGFNNVLKQAVENLAVVREIDVNALKISHLGTYSIPRLYFQLAGVLNNRL